ncbi:MAG: antibiotic biosynthesis monooxygenase [Actinomycetota bacterium]|nr:MAG: antibiotic biosynthesis monooxygenase [Actinomycetota bacterium]
MDEAVADRPVTQLLPGRIGMLVRLSAHPGGRTALLDALNRYVDHLDEEPGTELFAVALDPDDADVVWLQEWFHDEDAQRAHTASGPFQRLVHDMQDLLLSPPGLLRVDPLRVSLQPALLRDEIGLGP